MTLPERRPLLVPAIAASQFAPPFMISGVAVALPSLGADLGAGATALSLVETLFLAAAVAALLPAGRLGDAGDKAKLYKLGLAAFALTSIVIGLVPSILAVLALSVLQGVASAAVQAAGPAIVADLVPPERRGRAFGIIIGSIYAGLTLGPICAGLLVDHWNWRAVFIGGGAVVFALLVPVHLLLRASPRPKQPRPSQPLLDLELLRKNRVLRSSLAAQWLLYCNAFGTVFLLSLHMQSVLGHDAQTAGQVIAFGSLLMALIAPVTGILADRYRRSLIAAVGVAIALASALLGTRLGADSQLLAVGLVIAVQGIGFAFFSTPNMAMIMGAVPRERSGIASALAATTRSLGMVSGMLIVHALVSFYLGHQPIGADPARFVATMQASFWILVGTTAAALLISLRKSGSEPDLRKV